MKAVRRPLQLYAVILLLYAALAGWWVYFFEHESEMIVRHMAGIGGALSPEQVARLQEVTERHGRMFLAESAFLGMLMLGSVWLVLRALRREQMLAQQQRNFLSAVTHELRSPIASARLYIETLQLGRADGEKAERYLRHAHEDLTRLQALVEDLLEGRRLQHAGVAIAPEPLDLAAVVAGQLERLATTHGARGHLALHAPAPVPVLADPGAIERILDNLVSNGVKYGGPAGGVEIAVRAEGGRAVLLVRDHGPGLRGADRDAIFEAFVRGGDEAVRTEKGVGLGLFIVRELVAAHGGGVSARDGLPGGGTELRVELPLQAGPPLQADGETR